MSYNNVVIYDIETLKEMFLFGVYIPENKTYREFEISKNKNQIDALIRFTELYNDYYYVGYNNLSFDSQVVEYIIRNYENWHTSSSLEIVSKISQKANDVIHDSNYGVFPEYREDQLSFKQIDLFKIAHFDNKNRMVSLKRLEFEMDFENIEEMPIHHTKIDMTDDDIQKTKEYCKNDVMATYEFFKIIKGETEHALYKQNNQLQLRKDIQEEFGINCLNYSDSKIGDEIIKKYYCEEKRINYNELPKKGFFRKEILVKHCIASYVKFETKQLKDFLKMIQRKKLTIKDDFIETIKFYDVKYTFAKGGLHSVNNSEYYEANDEYEIIDWDVDSYYPAVGINNNKYPYHLGKEFLVGYRKMYEKRLEMKPLAKKDKRIAGIVGALKLAVNSVYGKSSDMLSWIYDKQYTMFTTITGELSLMMLIEMYELNNIKVISANTDGVTVYIKKIDIPKMMELNSKWCEITNYQLSRTDYKKIIFSTVNDYLAIKTDGEIKLKGDFLVDFELHKNKSARVCGIALREYYVNNVPIETTIKNHKNIYDFAIRQKASRDFHYEGINHKTKEQNKYDKLIRYYVSNTGEKLFKIKNASCTTNAANSSQIEAGEWLCYVCNHLSKNHSTENVNFEYYIQRANRIVNKIKLKGKKNNTIIIPNQLSIF